MTTPTSDTPCTQVSICTPVKYQHVELHGLLSAFSDLPLGLVIFKEGAHLTETEYPQTEAQIEKYVKIMNLEHPIRIEKEGLILTYFPEPTKRKFIEDAGYKIFDLVFNPSDGEVLDKVFQLPQLEGFPRNFVVYQPKGGCVWGDDFFQDLGLLVPPQY